MTLASVTVFLRPFLIRACLVILIRVSACVFEALSTFTFTSIDVISTTIDVY